MFEQLRRIISTLSPYIFSEKNYNKLKMVNALIIDIINTAANVIPPIMLAHYAKTSSEDDDDSSTSNMLVILFGTGFVLNQTLPNIRNMLINSVRANVQKELSLSMVEKSFNIELDYHLTTRTGEFSQALTKNYSTIDKLIPSFFGQVAPITMELLSVTVALLALYGPIGLLELGSLIAYVVTAAYRENKAQEIRTKCVTTSYRAYATLIESLGNYQVAHQFGNVEHEIKGVDRALTESEHMYSATHRIDDKNSLLLSSINTVGALVTLAYAALGMNLDTLDLAIISYFIFQFSTNLNNLAPAISSLHTAVIDSEKIVNFLHRESMVADVKGAVELDIVSAPTIEFKGVDFKYGDKVTLTDINFMVKPGQKVAIVGPTGVGKSTLIKLLLRFYKPEKGSISVNNLEIKEITSKSLREHIAVVAQDAILFNDTLAKNIKYGYLQASDDEVFEAAQAAELISSKDSKQLEASAGERGGKLSGGEKQRTSIARALLKGGVIYLLDEATSSLDAKTESFVQATLDKITQNATTLIVTHRLNTIVNADQIIYLNNGRIAEQGTFQELMEMKGLFFEQFSTQCRELGINPNLIIQKASVPSSSSPSRTVPDFWLARRQRQGRIEDFKIPAPPRTKSGEKTPLLTPSPRLGLQ